MSAPHSTFNIHTSEMPEHEDTSAAPDSHANLVMVESMSNQLPPYVDYGAGTTLEGHGGTFVNMHIMSLDDEAYWNAWLECRGKKKGKVASSAVYHKITNVMSPALRKLFPIGLNHGEDWFRTAVRQFDQEYTPMRLTNPYARTEYMLGILWISTLNPPGKPYRDHAIAWLHGLQDRVWEDEEPLPAPQTPTPETRNSETSLPHQHYAYRSKYPPSKANINYEDPRCLRCIEKNHRWCDRTSFDGTKRCYFCPEGVACIPEPMKPWIVGEPWPTYGE